MASWARSHVVSAVFLFTSAASPVNAETQSILEFLEGIGQSREEQSELKAVRSGLKKAISDPGHAVRWKNASNGHYGTIVAGEAFRNSGGSKCHRYRRTSITKEHEYELNGEYCHSIFGWHITNEKRVSKRALVSVTNNTPSRAVNQRPPTIAAPNSTVLETQRLLSQLGFDPGPVDGLYGNKTQRAIKDYQKARGLVVNGQPSTALMSALQSEASARLPTTPETKLTLEDANPTQRISSETANSTPQTASVLPEKTPDYCGPAGEEFRSKAKSFVVPDKLLGPFAHSCKAHDQCYVDAARRIIRSMEDRYKMSVASTGLLDKYRGEAEGLFEAEKLNCDQTFRSQVANTCRNNPSAMRTGSSWSCKTVGAMYFAGVRSKLGQNAFDRSLHTALLSPRPDGAENGQSEQVGISTERAKQERLANIEAEKRRLAKETVEQERLAEIRDTKQRRRIEDHAATGKLTKALAKRAIMKWLGTSGDVAKVTGIYEVPSQGGAVAEVVFKNFRYKRALNPMIAWGEKYKKLRIYSGIGKATFVHYNDGAWGLKKIWVPDPEVLPVGSSSWTIRRRIDTR